MAQHDATFNPLTYTVWYEYAAGSNSRLNHAMDGLLQGKRRLNNDDLWKLYQSHVAEVDPQAVHRIGDDMQRVMATLADAAGSTGQSADQFNAQLETLADGAAGHPEHGAHAQFDPGAGVRRQRQPV